MGCGASAQLKALKEDVNRLKVENDNLKRQKLEVEDEVEQQIAEIEKLERRKESLQIQLQEKEDCIRYEKMRNMIMEEMVAAEQVNVRLHVRRVEAMKTEMLCHGYTNSLKEEEVEEAREESNPLVEALSKSLAGTGTEVYNLTLDHMTEQIESCKGLLSKAFQGRDKKNCSLLKSQEFKAALRDGCQRLTKNESELLMLRFLEDDDLHVNYNHFLLYFEQRYQMLKETGAIRKLYTDEEIESALESLFAIWMEDRRAVEDRLEEAESEDEPGYLPVQDFETVLQLIPEELGLAEVMALTQGFREKENVNIVKLISKLNAMSKAHAKKNIDTATAVAVAANKFKKGGHDAKERSEKAKKTLEKDVTVAKAIGKFKKGAENAKEREAKEQKKRENAAKNLGEQMAVAKAVIKFKKGGAKEHQRKLEEQRLKRENEEKVRQILASIALLYDTLQESLDKLADEGESSISQAVFIEQVEDICEDLAQKKVKLLAVFFADEGDDEQVNHESFLEKLLERRKQVTCENDHMLTEFEVTENGLSCDRCGKEGVLKGTTMFGCLSCDHDVCAECRDPPLPEPELESKGAAPEEDFEDNEAEEAGEEDAFQPTQQVEVFVVQKIKRKEYKKWEAAEIEEKLENGNYKVKFANQAASVEVEIPPERIRKPGDESHPKAVEVANSPKPPPPKKRRGGCCGRGAADAVRTPEEMNNPVVQNSPADNTQKQSNTTNENKTDENKEITEIEEETDSDDGSSSKNSRKGQGG
mmetsp:Transcript_29107/g.37671  ORF Transcript_29107/g.37671 Transcript_29107/m.37671 type:complete len:758 (+) Transcript_29107:142-2415(+)